MESSVPASRPGDSHPPICVQSQSSRFAVRNVLAELTEGLAERGIDDMQLSMVELVAAEALNNVIEHACRFEDGVPFQVKAVVADNHLTLEIEDHGDAMPGLSLPATATGAESSPDVDVPTQDLPEGGWGWFLIHDLADDLSYSRVGDANRLVIRMSATP